MHCIGVIDSGSKPPSEFARFAPDLCLGSQMFDATKRIPGYINYYDSEGHGIGVVEILAKSLVPGIKLNVANVYGKYTQEIDAYHVATAFRKFRSSGVNIVNCSFSGNWYGE